MHEIVFDKKISAGNIVEIILILATIVFLYASMEAKVNNNHDRIIDIYSKTQEHQEYIEDTYMRKDVTEQVLIRLDEMNERLKRIEQNK